MASDEDRRYEVRTYDLEYLRVAGRAFQARAYQPVGGGPFPALLDVHGGAWNAGNGGRSMNALLDEALAASGMVVVALDFREAPEHPYPASIADANYATRWLKAHAADLNADGLRVGGLGTSSGGHVVMLSAMRPRDPRYLQHPLPEAGELDASLAYVIAAWPILDPHARYAFARETHRADLVVKTERYFFTEAAMQEGNPTLALERGEPVELPPTLILQGTEDANVTVAMQERFAAAFRRAGGEVRLEVFPGAPHGFARTPSSDTDRALTLMRDFIARQVAATIA